MIKIYNGRLVDARELHQFLESKQDFSNWINNRIKKYDFEEGEDYTINLLNRSDGLPGKPRKEYTLTLNMAKELAMVENNPKGKEARRYFIKAEEAFRELSENKRLSAFMKLEATKGKLLDKVINMGGSNDDFIQIDSNGRKVLFNGEPLPDEELSTLLIKGRDFATETTNLNIKEGDHTLEQVNDINEINHLGVREYIIDNTGKTPESMPKEQRVKKKNDVDKKLDK